MALSQYTKTAWANSTSPAINATNLGKIEDRLYDLTEEVLTPSMETTTTVTQEITSLPSTTLKSRLDTTIQGNTYANLIRNGNFENGTSEWYYYSVSTNTVTNNILTNTANGVASNGYAYQPSNNIPSLNDKIYQVATIRVTNSDSTSIRIYLYDGIVTYTTSSANQFNPTQNLWYKLSGIHTITSASPTQTQTYVIHYYPDSATANGKSMEVQEVMTINLTQLFGAGNEPTLAEADEMFANWFDGVESTKKQLVKSVGKNLFDKSKVVLGKYFASNGAFAVVSNSWYAENYILVSASTAYIITNYTGVAIAEYDNTRTFLRRIVSNTFTTASNAKYIRVSYSNTFNGDIELVQLEQGTTATDYESYTETTAMIPAELRKVSSTIYDTYDANSGQHTKNVEEAEISGTVYDSIDTSTYTNVDVVKTTAFTLMKPATTGIDSATRLFDKTFKQLEEVAQADIDLVASAGKYYVHTDETIWFIVANGTYADIATARTGLGTSTLLYQLATPVITNYYPNTLTAEPSGTVYTYPFITDYDFYDTGAGVNDTAYPIQSLEYVNIVNKDTGALTPVDLSTCTIASDGLSFTSTALTADDLVDFGYTYRWLSTIPTLEYKHPTNLKATVDGNTNNIRDLDEKIEQSNTVTTLTLKEIERDARILKIMGGI